MDHSQFIFRLLLEHNFLSDNDFLNLSLVNRTSMQLFQPYVSARVFTCPTRKYEKSFSFKYYSPRILQNVDSLFTISNSSIQLTHITFSSDFNSPISTPLPHSIEHITFGKKFNTKITTLPPHLKTLKFGNHFNKPLPVLPSSLTHLQFWEPYRPQHVWYWPDEVMENLEYLSFLLRKEHNDKSNFNQSLDGVLPRSLTHLILGNKYKCKITQLPSDNQLSHLYLGNSFTHILPFSQLPNLEMLLLGKSYPLASCTNLLPPSLKTLAIRNKIFGDLSKCESITTLALYKTLAYSQEFPPNLKHAFFHKNTLFRNTSILRKLPTVTHLHLHKPMSYHEQFVFEYSGFVIPGVNLPPNLTHLTYNSFSVAPKIAGDTITWLNAPMATHILFNELISLTHFSSNCNKFSAIPPEFPNNSKLTHLSLIDGALIAHQWSMQKNYHSFSNSITHIKLYEREIIDLSHLPHNLEYLNCCIRKNTSNLSKEKIRIIIPKSFPPSLHTLCFPTEFNPALGNLPSHIKLTPQHLKMVSLIRHNNLDIFDQLE